MESVHSPSARWTLEAPWGAPISFVGQPAAEVALLLSRRKNLHWFVDLVRAKWSVAECTYIFHVCYTLCTYLFPLISGYPHNGHIRQNRERSAQQFSLYVLVSQCLWAYHAKTAFLFLNSYLGLCWRWPDSILVVALRNTIDRWKTWESMQITGPAMGFKGVACPYHRGPTQQTHGLLDPSTTAVSSTKSLLKTTC